MITPIITILFKRNAISPWNNPRILCTLVAARAKTPCTLENSVLRREVKTSRMDWRRLVMEARIPVIVAIVMKKGYAAGGFWLCFEWFERLFLQAVFLRMLQREVSELMG